MNGVGSGSVTYGKAKGNEVNSHVAGEPYRTRSYELIIVRLFDRAAMPLFWNQIKHVAARLKNIGECDVGTSVDSKIQRLKRP